MDRRVVTCDACAIPRRGFITKVKWSSEPIMLPGDIETVTRFNGAMIGTRASLFRCRDPAGSAPECRYVSIDEAGRVVYAGLSDFGENSA